MKARVLAAALHSCTHYQHAQRRFSCQCSHYEARDEVRSKEQLVSSRRGKPFSCCVLIIALNDLDILLKEL
jgi:hypothetical protein